MAKVLVEGDSVDIRVSLLERVVLAEKSRKLPLARIRHVDPHPPLLDMMLHWSDQTGSWLCGVSSYDGHMVPSARHPGSTLAIDLDGDPLERIYIELDDESPCDVAARIERALLAGTPANDTSLALLDAQLEQPLRTSEIEVVVQPRARALESNAAALRPRDDLHASVVERQAALFEALDIELDDEEIRHRDPLMQGSLPPGPPLRSEPAPEPHPAAERDLSRVGGWLVGFGSLGLLGGGVMLASGAAPGVFAVGAGVAAALLGGVALAVVARHQD
jgi:hypothetical protein